MNMYHSTEQKYQRHRPQYIGMYLQFYSIPTCRGIAANRYRDLSDLRPSETR